MYGGDGEVICLMGEVSVALGQELIRACYLNYII